MVMLRIRQGSCHKITANLTLHSIILQILIRYFNQDSGAAFKINFQNICRIKD